MICMVRYVRTRGKTDVAAAAPGINRTFDESLVRIYAPGMYSVWHIFCTTAVLPLLFLLHIARTAVPYK